MEADARQIQVASVRLGGAGLVIVPTRAVADKAIEVMLPKGDAMIKAVFGDIQELQMLGDGKSFEKSKMFDSVAVIRSDDPTSVSMSGYDYKVWATKAGAGPTLWHMARAGGNAMALTPPATALSRVARWNALQISLVNAAADLGMPFARRPLPQPPAKAAAPATPTKPAVTSGTGFFINREGHVLTNAHVVAGCKSVKMQRSGDVPVEVATLAVDRINDLAVVKAPAPSPVIAHFSTTAARQGQDVVVYGFPLAGVLAPQGNLTTGIVSALAGIANDTRQLQISAPVQPGNSGGPLMDNSGNVIGVVVSKINALSVAKATGDIPQNINFAIKASTAIEFLKSNGVGVDANASRKPLHASDVADQAKTFTVMLICQN